MQYPARLTRDPAGSDADAATFLPTLTQHSAGDVDLSSYTTETDQLRLSACAGNATADSIECLTAIAEENQAKLDGRAAAPVTQVSRLFIYSMTRQRLGNLDKDGGTYIRACFDTLSRFGVCPETSWPYDPSKVFTSPSVLAQRQAVGNRIHGQYKIQDDSSRTDQVVQALRASHPVVFGTTISKSFMALKNDAPQGPPTSDLVGAHAMLIVGYINGHFLVKNSWGANWGADGFWMMTPEYLEWSQTFDLWVPTMGDLF